MQPVKPAAHEDEQGDHLQGCCQGIGQRQSTQGHPTQILEDAGEEEAETEVEAQPRLAADDDGAHDHGRAGIVHGRTRARLVISTREWLTSPSEYHRSAQATIWVRAFVEHAAPLVEGGYQGLAQKDESNRGGDGEQQHPAQHCSRQPRAHFDLLPSATWAENEGSVRMAMDWAMAISGMSIRLKASTRAEALPAGRLRAIMG